MVELFVEFQLDPIALIIRKERFLTMSSEVHNVGSVKYCNKTQKKKSASVIDPMGFLVDFVSLIIFVNLICNTKPYYSLSFAVSK